MSIINFPCNVPVQIGFGANATKVKGVPSPACPVAPHVMRCYVSFIFPFILLLTDTSFYFFYIARCYFFYFSVYTRDQKIQGSSLLFLVTFLPSTDTFPFLTFNCFLCFFYTSRFQNCFII